MKDYIKMIDDARKSAAKNINTSSSVRLGKWGQRHPLKVVFKYHGNLEVCNVFYMETVGGVDYDFNAAWFYSSKLTSSEIFDFAIKSGESL